MMKILVILVFFILVPTRLFAENPSDEINNLELRYPEIASGCNVSCLDAAILKAPELSKITVITQDKIALGWILYNYWQGERHASLYGNPSLDWWNGSQKSRLNGYFNLLGLTSPYPDPPEQIESAPNTPIHTKSRVGCRNPNIVIPWDMWISGPIREPPCKP